MPALTRVGDAFVRIAADHVRARRIVGLIDPSRQSPGLWHITLFRWNAPDGPAVAPLGEPEPIAMDR